jgi:tetratricopeptide (TPR) repeat protein
MFLRLLFLTLMPLLSAQLVLAVAQSFTELFAKIDADLRAGNVDAAIKECNGIIVLNLTPQLASAAIMRRGSCYYAKHDAERAIADYDQALRLDPKNAAAYDNRGNALEARGDLDDAMKDYSESVRLNPRNSYVYVNRGVLRSDEADFSGALADFARALSLNPRSEYAHAGRSRVYLLRNEPEKALEEANAAIAISPDEALGYDRRARAYVKLGRYAQVDADIRKATHLKSYDRTSGLSLVAWFRATCPDPHFRDGKQALEAARLSCGSTNFFGYGCLDNLAAAYAEVGDFDQAVNCQTQALEKAPSRYPELSEMKQRLEQYKKRKPYRDEPKRKPS